MGGEIVVSRCARGAQGGNPVEAATGQIVVSLVEVPTGQVDAGPHVALRVVVVAVWADPATAEVPELGPLTSQVEGPVSPVVEDRKVDSHVDAVGTK